MGFGLRKHRRWLGGVILLAAAAMLIAGETLLKGKLAGLSFIAYWLGCLVLTSIAIVVALADLRAQSETARAAHRELLESALKEIEAKAKEKERGGTPAKAAGRKMEMPFPPPRKIAPN